MITGTEGADCSLTFDTEVFSLETLKKAAYKFADRFSVVIAPVEGRSVRVDLIFSGAKAKVDPAVALADFRTEVLDQDLREIVKREAGPLRNLILAHAFSRTSLVDQG